MRTWSRRLAPLLLGYLLGTIPSADIAARVAGGPDLRTTGSNNPGASNAAAVLGPRFGLAVLIVDIAKGAVAGRLGRTMAGSSGASAAASAAVIGHCHPVWRRFSGGKGVATSVGQVLSTFPVYFPIDATVAVASAASPRWKQRAFSATSISSVVWVLATTLWWRRQWPTGVGCAKEGAPSRQATGALPLGALVSSLVILARFWAAQSQPAGTTASPARSAEGPDGPLEQAQTEVD